MGPVMIAMLSTGGAGLAYLKGKYDSFFGKWGFVPKPTVAQSVFSSPYILALTVVLALITFSSFSKIVKAVKGAFK